MGIDSIHLTAMPRAVLLEGWTEAKPRANVCLRPEHRAVLQVA